MEFYDDQIVSYGSVSLRKAWCILCKSNSIVDLDNQILLCCGLEYIPSKTMKRLMGSVNERKRKFLKKDSKKKEILESQDYKCIYCELPFGSVVIRYGKAIWLRICWDHFIPLVFGDDNSEANFVAACQICNGIKSSIVFEDLLDAREYIMKKRKIKGYIDIDF